MYDDMFKGSMSIVKEHAGFGVPTIKLWGREHMAWRIELAKEEYVLALASDIDARDLTNLRKSVIPVGFKNVEELRMIAASYEEVPFL